MAWYKISSKICLTKQNNLLKTSTYVAAKKRRGNLLLAKNNSLLKTSINSPIKKQYYKKSTWIHRCDFMWNHVIACEMMWSYVKFNMWKNFTRNHMWNFPNERISHEITCDISHVKGFHMKSHVTFYMWKDFIWNYKLQVKFHIWSDFTWNYKRNFTCERIRS
jgi:hypothetical protein